MASLKYQTQSIQNKSSHLPLTHYPPPIILPQRRVPTLTQLAKPETKDLWLLLPNHIWCRSLPHLHSSVQSLSCVLLFMTPCTAVRQASLSVTNTQSLLKLMSIESVMPSNHLILWRPLLLPSIFPSIRVFSNESVLSIRWPKYWSFSISPTNEYSGLISFRMDWLALLAVQGTPLRAFSNTTVQKHQIFGTQLSL